MNDVPAKGPERQDSLRVLYEAGIPALSLMLSRQVPAWAEEARRHGQPKA